mmetsp:Transcript_62922/g.99815  ORF Transcript_62922/g.99815 Transcript_62922/m.99815 type:complete len:154 (+) Transcript_62922:44-505(+)
MLIEVASPARPVKRRKVSSSEVALYLEEVLPSCRSPSLASWRLSQELAVLAAVAFRDGRLRVRQDGPLQALVEISGLRPDGSEAVEIVFECPENYPLVPPLLRHSNWRCSGQVPGWIYQGDLLQLERLQVDRWSFTMGFADLLADLLDVTAAK